MSSVLMVSGCVQSDSYTSLVPNAQQRSYRTYLRSEEPSDGGARSKEPSWLFKASVDDFLAGRCTSPH